MRQRALGLADELEASRTSDLRPPVPEKDITDSVELLRWLAREHFTFLGYREYKLEHGSDGEARLEAVPGTGLGILRQDQTTPRVLSSMTPEAYAKVLEKRLLIITKANSRATVQRSAYLDYIGFKIFDDTGQVDRRAPVPGPVLQRRLPHQRPRAAGRAPQGRRGARPLRPVPAQPLRQGPAPDPGDLSARRAVPDQDRRPLPRGHRRAADGRAPATAAVPAPRRVRPVHLLPDLPAARPVHHPEPAAHAGHPARRAERDRRRLHDPGHRVDARAGPLHRAHRPGQPAGRDRRRRARRAARRRDPAVGRRLQPRARAQARRRADQGAVLPVRQRVPRGLQGREHAVRGPQGPRQAGAARGAGPAGDAPVPQEPRRHQRQVQGLPVRRADGALGRAAGAALAGRAGRRRAAVRDQPWRRHRLPLRFRPPAARRRPRPARGAPARGERVRGGLARRSRGRRVQPARPARRAHLAAGGGAALVRQVPAPGRHGVLAGIHGVDVRRLPGHRRAARGALRGAVLAGAAPVRGGAHAAEQGAGRRDRPAARRRGQPRPGPHHALLPHADPGDPADELLPARNRG